MSALKHTSAPWSIVKCACGDAVCNQHTISVQRSAGFDKADALLIAAAPDLLAALQRYLNCDRSIDTPGDTPAAQARAAIAKATGAA